MTQANTTRRSLLALAVAAGLGMASACTEQKLWQGPLPSATASTAATEQCPQDSLAQHAPVPVVVEKTYHQARKLLIAAGWQPLQSHSHNDVAQDPTFAYGNGETYWQLGYTEVESCAGTGLAPCAFLYQDIYGNKLRVVTQGEEDAEEQAKAVVVSARLLRETEDGF